MNTKRPTRRKHFAGSRWWFQRGRKAATEAAAAEGFAQLHKVVDAATDHPEKDAASEPKPLEDVPGDITMFHHASRMNSK